MSRVWFFIVAVGFFLVRELSLFFSSLAAFVYGKKTEEE